MCPDETGWIRPHLDAPRRTRGKESKNKIEYKMRGIWDAQSVCHPAFLLYSVFARRVNTFVTSFSPFFCIINIVINDFTYSKFCEDSEYVHFKKLKLS